MVYESSASLKGWNVYEENSNVSYLVSKHRLKKNAVKDGKGIARKGGDSLITRRMDGTIQKRIDRENWRNYEV